MLTAISKNQDDARKKIQALLEQMFVLTANDCLDDWEIFLGIQIDHTQLVRDRRKRILNKIQGTQPVTVAFLTNVVNQYVADQAAEIEEHNDDYYINILFHGGQVMDFEALQNAIRTYLPAHIGYKLINIVRGNLTEYSGGTVQCYRVTNVDSSLDYHIDVEESQMYAVGAVIHQHKSYKIIGGVN